MIITRWHPLLSGHELDTPSFISSIGRVMGIMLEVLPQKLKMGINPSSCRVRWTNNAPYTTLIKSSFGMRMTKILRPVFAWNCSFVLFLIYLTDVYYIPFYDNNEHFWLHIKLFSSYMSPLSIFYYKYRFWSHLCML